MKRYPHPMSSVSMTATEALDEVNDERAKQGLHPFKRDALLTGAAMSIAAYRAEHLIHGHTPNDFKFLPEGATAKSAGCGALEDWWGWGSCCTFDAWTIAGAAWARGRDGLRYMHIFVR